MNKTKINNAINFKKLILCRITVRFDDGIAVVRHGLHQLFYRIRFNLRPLFSQMMHKFIAIFMIVFYH
jgi:hypothetical protein